MGDNTDRASETGMDRRKFLAGVGAGAAASVAGCTGGGGGTPTPRVETVERTVEKTRIVEKTDTPTATPREGGGESSGLLFNPMGYTGADDLINQQAELMAAEPRKPLVKKVLATIWNDAPTNVMFYDKLLNPVNDDWTGWIPTVGGPMTAASNLNIQGPSSQPVIGMDTAPDSLKCWSTPGCGIVW